uniref:Uncharacterized protein n=1 Tax=Trichogramma kaykai TaxID=54128 RepID=A0ABD2WW22_9HYME
MMESKEDTVRMKEEPNDTWPDTDDNYNTELVNYCKFENFTTSTFYKPSTTVRLTTKKRSENNPKRDKGVDVA